MPGMIYGWPKNVFHQVGLQASILDITATLRPHFAIVDGVTGASLTSAAMEVIVNNQIAELRKEAAE